MKSMDFFARLGADPPPHPQCGKGLQRRMAEKDAISGGRICESNYLLLRPCEVSSRIAHATILEVAEDTLGSLLKHRHVFVGSVA